ncbi:putative type 1 isopentenyl-diphosphate delta-isomerase 1 [Baffinella frigidus]|nr:putative type 1 isopentenyl-diphosphate delta-isomerase 1 [Cryptophyta sp. CCMP2293]
MAAEGWTGEGKSQLDFMFKDECILLDMDDNVVGHDNKYETHIFCPERPRGKLHRAFSVFLFDEQGRLLLQQRAKEKITFPEVWTNTCCSHPLFGFEPTEVDSPEDVAAGTVPGVRRAAVRKLKHELGIEAEQLPIESFKFLTRLHYWAADVVTHGETAPWGEHEIDYILFIQAKVDLKLNPEEVMAYKYVSMPELMAQMMPESGQLWSPWFRIIASRFLVPLWWSNLGDTLTTQVHFDPKTIHRFDCTEEHMGGAGDASIWLDHEGRTEFGDVWLGQVATNGGKAPVTPAMKDLLASDRNNRWRLEAQE